MKDQNILLLVHGFENSTDESRAELADEFIQQTGRKMFECDGSI